MILLTFSIYKVVHIRVKVELLKKELHFYTNHLVEQSLDTYPPIIVVFSFFLFITLGQVRKVRLNWVMDSPAMLGTPAWVRHREKKLPLIINSL